MSVPTAIDRNYPLHEARELLQIEVEIGIAAIERGAVVSLAIGASS